MEVERKVRSLPSHKTFNRLLELEKMSKYTVRVK